jgi:hypothetical protein
VFLRLASPSGVRLHAPGSSWWLAGLATLGMCSSRWPWSSGRITCPARPGPTGRRCLPLPGISWGFVAAVIKELRSHLDDGIGVIVSN